MFPESSSPAVLCACGCGLPVGYRKRTNTRLGLVKGQLTRFLDGHSSAHGNIEEYILSRCVPDNGCLMWTGGLEWTGYGRVWHDDRRWKVHRLLYILRHGPIPQHIFVCHTCDRRACCLDAHLFAGTKTDNARDMAAKGRAPGQIHPERYRGERNAMTKVADSDVLTICALYATGLYSQRELADQFGIGETTVGRYVRHTERAHLFAPSAAPPSCP